MKMIAATLIAAAGLTAAASAQVTLTELARVDLTSAYASTDNGTNPSAVAWNGSSAWVAGFNGGSNANTGIFQVSNVLSSPSFGASFGVLATPGLRGYSGLALNGNNLAAAYDDGAADPNGIASYNATTGAQNWAKNARGGSGVAFDPGFNGVDSGVAWTTFGSGRRALQNAATGADIYTTANGMIINVGSGTFWRSMDFDPNTGDLYARRSNGPIKVPRTGGNSGAAAELIPFTAVADFIAGHNMAFMSDSPFGDVIVYNDRTTTALGQGYTNVIKAVDSSGAAQAINWNFLAPVADGSGYYDFSYDAATQTLAVLDYTNRTLQIFAVPAPGAAALMGLAGLVGLRRRR